MLEKVEQNILFIVEKKILLEDRQNGLTTFQLDEENNILANQLKQMKQLLKNQLDEISIKTRLDQLYQSLNNISLEMNYNEKDQVSFKKRKLNDGKVEYPLIQKSCYKQNEKCYAIAFNQDSTIMVAGCENLIKVFGFKADKLSQIQQLNNHSGFVLCLKFMKKSNQFLSTSSDSTIIIWEQNQNNQWQFNQVLKSHSSYIRQIIINKNEDMLISGSGDKTIKFWCKQNCTWSSYQSIDCQSEVFSISLSDQEDKLITSISDNQILIIQLLNNNWKIKQTMQIDQFGYRLCFIDQNQFVFQPFNRQNLIIFNYDLENQIFKQEQELQYLKKASEGCALFPIHYISEIGIIVVKNDHHIHLIRRKQNSEFSVEQSINFGTNDLFGGITDDGRYLATWDNKSKEIQIRKSEF